MKLIVACMRPEAPREVKAKLCAKEVCSLPVTNILGSGRQRGHTEVCRGVQTEVNPSRRSAWK
jgi:nitrogen regulatory protein P-II 1